MVLLVWFLVLGATLYAAIYLASCAQMTAVPFEEGVDAVSDGRLFRWVGLFMVALGLMGTGLLALGPIVTLAHLTMAAPLLAGGRLLLDLGTRRYLWNSDGLSVHGLLLRSRHYPWDTLATVRRRHWLGAHSLEFDGRRVLLPDGMRGGESLVRAARQRLEASAF
ncbi:MAG: hypothetical protein AAF577_09520 [Pseudomonadota bacterium]